MKHTLIILLALLLLLSSCTRAQTQIADANALSAQKMPADLPAGEVGDATFLTSFAGHLFQRVAALEEQNPLLSPFSAYLCLALVANGASGATRDEFIDVLGCDTDALNSFSHALIATLSDTKGATKLATANSAWADNDRMSVDEDYLQRIVDYYGADVYSTDLPSDGALDAINRWINEKTNGLIPKLHEDNYPDETVLVLINALYFKAEWARKFDAFATHDKTFTPDSGTPVSVPFLNSHGDHALITAADAEGIVLPYDDGKTAFVALRPTDGKTARSFAAGLTSDALKAYLAAAETTYADFSMPKFTVEFSLSMRDMLQGMGLQTMFDPDHADLGRIGTAKAGNVYVSDVFQKVKLIVDEDGTEAAAVTEAALAGSAFIQDPAQLHLDSPFVYAVVDLATDVPLFAGVLDHPVQ